MAETMGREQTFFKILVFFAVITVITGILNGANAGWIDINTLGNANFDNSIALKTDISTDYSQAFSSGSPSQGNITTEIDLRTATSLNENLITKTGGPWTLVSGSGLLLTGTTLLGEFIDPSVVLLNNVQSSDNVYSVTYIVSNPTGADFYVSPRFVTGSSGNDLKIVFSSDGVHLKKYPPAYGFFDAGDDYYYPTSNIQETEITGSYITTTLKEAYSSDQISSDYTALLSVSKDGVPLFTDVPARSFLPASTHTIQMLKYGGVGSNTIGFIFHGTTNTPQSQTSSTLSPESIIDSILSAVQIAGMFFDGLAVVFGMSESAVVPFWLWSIIALPCLSTLAFIGIEIVRGN